jgi:hypothetical protein
MKYSVDINWVHLIDGVIISRISLLIFCLDDLSIGDRGVLKYPTTTVLESMCGFKNFNVCLMNLGSLTLSAYRVIIAISF